jgi:hypothetical protein
VRLSKATRTFKKGYLPNWTEELFTVVKCIETRPPVYLVKDDHGEILEGTFYAEEIQKVIKTDDVYKIEPILKKRKKGRRVQYLVKWESSFHKSPKTIHSRVTRCHSQN